MTLQEWKANLKAVEACHVSYDWEDTDGTILFHERNNFLRSCFSPMPLEYLSERIYTSKKLAEQDAKRYGGKVMQCFYADPGTLWFIRFKDFNAVAKYIFETTVLNGCSRT